LNEALLAKAAQARLLRTTLGCVRIPRWCLPTGVGAENPIRVMRRACIR
jgi:hypothetical protein